VVSLGRGIAAGYGKAVQADHGLPAVVDARCEAQGPG
jgi:hypothetical protein